MARGPSSKLAEARIWTLEHTANLEGNTYYDSEGNYHPSYTKSIIPFKAPPPGRVPDRPVYVGSVAEWTLKHPEDKDLSGYRAFFAKFAIPYESWSVSNPGKTMRDYLDTYVNPIMYPKDRKTVVSGPPEKRFEVLKSIKVSGWMPLSSSRKGEGLPQRSLYKGVR